MGLSTMTPQGEKEVPTRWGGYKIRTSGNIKNLGRPSV